ncbi:hypothetical protein PM082_013806 [Marasmius tenuissimus]|nr:hypothetical protein PM082_013806 [Marasmius tenuissimus]
MAEGKWDKMEVLVASGFRTAVVAGKVMETSYTTLPTHHLDRQLVVLVRMKSGFERLGVVRRCWE